MFHITMSYRTSQRTFFPFALLLAICHVEAAYLDGIAMLNFLIYYDTFISLCNLHPYYFYDAPINLRLILFYSLNSFTYMLFFVCTRFISFRAPSAPRSYRLCRERSFRELFAWFRGLCPKETQHLRSVRFQSQIRPLFPCLLS